MSLHRIIAALLLMAHAVTGTSLIPGTMAALAGTSGNTGATVLAPTGGSVLGGIGRIRKRSLDGANSRAGFLVALSQQLRAMSSAQSPMCPVVRRNFDNDDAVQDWEQQGRRRSHRVRLFKREPVALVAFFTIWSTVFLVGTLMSVNAMFVPDWFFNQQNYLYYQGKVAYNLLD